ncbi:MAG TPA: hypothetical protein VMT04_00490 [Terriglobales bacterium]|nr:hypothetical protein [Terriglobales bacterium]
MLDNRIAIFGGIFLGLGLILLFVLFIWILRRSRFAQEKEEKGYGGLIRVIIFIVSILSIILAAIFFQMQDYMRPFQALTSEKLVGEITIGTSKDSVANLALNTIGEKGKTYKETFEVSQNGKFSLVMEVLVWEKWLKFFGFVNGYKLSQVEILPAGASTDEMKTYDLSGGPAEGWKKIYSLRKILFFVKPEELRSGTFLLNQGETKKIYIKDKKLIVE